jgi:hypothetical protein
MNLTAFIYIVPLLVVELLWVCMLSNWTSRQMQTCYKRR